MNVSGTSHSRKDAAASKWQPEIAIFPLNTVLFPDGLLPLRIFEQRYMEMAKQCLKEDLPFGICLIRSGKEVGEPAVHEPVGCTARIVHWEMQQLGVLSVRVRGESKFRIERSWVTESRLTRAYVEPVPYDTDMALPTEFSGCAALLRAIVGEHGEEIMATPHRFDSCSWVGSRLAEILPMSLPAKQRLLEIGNGRERVEIVHRFLLQHQLAQA